MPEFDNTTVTKMTTAIDLGCKHLSGHFDTARNRTRISDAIVSAAMSGKRTLAQFIDVSLNEVLAITGPRPTVIQKARGWLARCKVVFWT